MQHSSSSSISKIKRARKESVLFREISNQIRKAAMDDDRLQEAFVNRVKLSSDKSMCNVFFVSPKGLEYFEENILDLLKCYKPSLRKAISQNVAGRYTPDIRFKYDFEQEKQNKVNTLIDKLKEEGKL